MSEAKDVIADRLERYVFGSELLTQDELADAILSALKEAGWVLVTQKLWDVLLDDLADEYMGGPVGLNVVRDP